MRNLLIKFSGTHFSGGTEKTDSELSLKPRLNCVGER